MSRDQLLRNRVLRALRSLKSYPSFPRDFQTFVMEEARREADQILNEKDVRRTEFTVEDLRKFSYKEELQRFQRTNPLLLACVAGTISKCKVRIDLLFSIV